MKGKDGKDERDLKDEKEMGFRDPFGEGYGLSDFCNMMSVLALRRRRWQGVGVFVLEGWG